MTVPSDCSQLGCEVEVASIDLELKKLWEADDARTNASLINFAVYSENASALSTNSDLVREITREHACRAILIGVDREDPEVGMRAWITAHCNLAHGKKTVCSEQLAFHLSGCVSGRLSNTVFAHLSSDLPLIFWWQGELTERFNNRLYSLIDRLVVDSAEWAKPRLQFDKLTKAISEEQLVVQDLSWTRTYQVRLAIASLFDDPMAQTAIGAIKKIRIVTSPHCRVSGLQLLAWFSVQCGWKKAEELISTEDCNGGFLFEHDHGGLVEVCVVTDENSAPIGSVEIDAGEMQARVTHTKGDHLLHLHLVCNGHTLEQSAPAESPNVVGLVKDQLSRGGKNSLFRKIYPDFLRLLEAE